MSMTMYLARSGRTTCGGWCASVRECLLNVVPRSAAATALDLRAYPTRAFPNPDREPPRAPTLDPRGRASPGVRRGSAAPPADTWPAWPRALARRTEPRLQPDLPLPEQEERR